MNALILFAQQNKFGQQPNAGGDAAAAGAMGFLLCFYGVIIVVAIAIQVMFLLTMSKCLKQIAPRNRRMEPGQVWLCLIPIFGAVWTLIMILRVGDSLKDEYDDRGLREDGDFGKTLGIVYFVSAFICGIVSLVCFIMYWVKIAGYNRTLAETGGGGGGSRRGRSRDDDYDDEDDRPRRRRRDEDDDDDR